ncbi:MAG: hypothetical protein L6Q38_16505, partial [Nitrospira sp.]|nr:hypothetical protein [Nitrospira sp.]
YLKAYYENLYSLAGGLANTYAVLFKRHEFTTGNVMVGPTRGQALGSSDQQEKDVGKILQELEKHLQMRHQEVHFWVQIAAVLTTPGRSEVRLGVYKDFQKASLPVAGSTAVPPTKFEDAWQVQLPEIFDLVDRAYKVFCGRADAWLTGRGEVIDYSDFSTHGNAKPIPVPCTYMGDDPLLRPW